jgi:hypothetical protein
MMMMAAIILAWSDLSGLPDAFSRPLTVGSISIARRPAKMIRA